MNSSSIPSAWKLSNATPIYKKKESTNNKIYWPVSVLSGIRKLYEKVIYYQLSAIVTPIFSQIMSGFIKGHSCATALIKLTDDWRTALDERNDVAAVGIDLSKAFDSVCHNLLVAKIKVYDFKDSALKLLQAYRDKRKH